jgi:pimeloyl-ACP methyl ester carboxylesterase
MSRHLGSWTLLFIAGYFVPAVETASGQVIYSNFGPDGTFQGGLAELIGPTNPEFNQVMAQPFAPATTVRFSSAQLGMATSGGTTANVYLESDSGSLPGAIIDTLVQDGVISSTPTAVTFKCSVCPLLTGGTQYWLVVQEGNGPTLWNWSNSDTGPFATSQNGSATGPWFPLNARRSAFAIYGAGCQANSCLSVLNPFGLYASVKAVPPTLDSPTVMSSPSAISLAADGESAVVLAYRSQSSQPVTFELSASGIELTAPVGSLSVFDPDYLKTPNPPGGSPLQVSVEARDNNGNSTCDASGTCTFLALLWGPNAMPVPSIPLADLTVTATQQGQAQTARASIALEPPPLLLIHGIWSSARGAGFSPGSNGFFDWIAGQYPHSLIYPVDYGTNSSKAFSDSSTQWVLLSKMQDALADAAAKGMAARSVDVVAHSMGGLVTRYFLSQGPPSQSPELLPNPVHKLITIGTPHLGTNLATTLVNNQDTIVATSNPLVLAGCLAFSTCTLGDLFGGVLHKPVGTGTQSLEPGSSQLFQLSTTNVFSTIVGSAPTSPLSVSEALLDTILGAFLPGQTVGSILNNQLNDTIVPIGSQNPPGAYDAATVAGIVHTSLCDLPVLSPVCPDYGETQSQAVWSQAYWWLTGGTAYAPAPTVAPSTSPRALTSPATIPPPVLNLAGYTQVPPSNVAFLPATGSILTINSATNIVATSSTKTITEVLLLQTASDPTDTVLLYATQSPFSISFTPTRLGSANFGAVAVFSDNTYALTALTYTLQPSGTPYALNLVNTPVANMTLGTSRVIEADALFTSGPIDVTQVAAYTAASGSASVFSVGAGGTITANGNGLDLLQVS